MAPRPLHIKSPYSAPLHERRGRGDEREHANRSRCSLARRELGALAVPHLVSGGTWDQDRLAGPVCCQFQRSDSICFCLPVALCSPHLALQLPATQRVEPNWALGANVNLSATSANTSQSSNLIAATLALALPLRSLLASSARLRYTKMRLTASRRL